MTKHIGIGHHKVVKGGVQSFLPLKSSVSFLAMCTLLAAAPAFAQGAGAPAEGDAESDAIIVTGIRGSLASAQAIKRNADTVVDSITAQDIGALPDRSVTEALQRIPGIAINRFAGSNDPDHFSVEGSGVVIRGLNFVRSEFNGRDAFSAGVGGQSLNFADVPSELLGGVDVYKNSTAELIEGGLAGTVNLKTRLPLDKKGFRVGFNAEANYGDFRKKWTPTGSLLLSNTWETDSGTFGLLGSASYSRLKSRADGIQVTNFQTRNNTEAVYQNGGGVKVCTNPLPTSTDTLSLPAQISGVNAFCGAAQGPGADGRADFRPLSFTPLGGQFRTQDFDRTRQGQALAFQWESTDRETLFTAQFLRSHSSSAWGEYTFETAPDLSEYNTYPMGCHQNGNGPLYNNNGTTRAQCRINSSGQFFFSGNDRGNGNPAGSGTYSNYVYDADNLFQKGYITLPGTGWRTAGSGNGATNWVPSGGMQQSLSRRQVLEKNTVTDFGMNLRTSFSERLHATFDVDYVSAKRSQTDLSVFGSTFADNELDLTGALPVVIPHKPATLSATWAGANPALVSATDDQYFRDKRVQFWRAAMDHLEESDGDAIALRSDFVYDFDDTSFIKKVKFGARYADRDQHVRYTTYNWGAISEVWSGAPVSLAQAGGNQTSFYDFPNFFRGQTPGPVGGYYYNGDLINGYDQASTFFKSLNDVWKAPTSAGGGGATATNRWVPARERPYVIPGTGYRPDEMQRVSQRDINAYVMLNFGQDNGEGLRFSGNIGLRYVNTKLQSDGTSIIPDQTILNITQSYATACALSVPAGAPPGTAPSNSRAVCRLGEAQYNQLRQWTGTTPTFTPLSATKTYDYWLPSLNVKFQATDDVIIRFAASRVLARPENSYVRNYQQTTQDGNANLQANVGNPDLFPAKAWQFDLTAEWYFARVGSLTFDVYYKRVKDFFYQATPALPITNNGVTFPVAQRGPANFHGTGTIKGFEIAYQQTFDFLPGLLSGFGVNANYSYIESSGLPNTFLNTGSPVNVGNIKPGNLPLEGLSKHNVNVAAFYEKGPISLRAAYNWRSRFLLTAADVIFPYTSIFNEATGNLDASLFVNVTKEVKIGVQGVNLLNEVLKTSQAYTGDAAKLAPRSYFMNDRRFSFIVRGNF